MNKAYESIKRGLKEALKFAQGRDNGTKVHVFPRGNVKSPRLRIGMNERQQLKIQEALLLYTRGLVSLGRAAELSGLTEEGMMRHARASGVQPRWTEEMVQEELQ